MYKRQRSTLPFKGDEDLILKSLVKSFWVANRLVESLFMRLSRVNLRRMVKHSLDCLLVLTISVLIVSILHTV